MPVTIRLADLDEDVHPTIIFGRYVEGTVYRHVGLDQLIGHTVVGVAEGTIEGSDGDETVTYLLFDGYAHGFVHSFTPSEKDTD